MSTEEKSSLIAAIIAHLRFEAGNRKKAFDGGDVFFMLALKSDEELRKIAKLIGI